MVHVMIGVPLFQVLSKLKEPVEEDSDIPYNTAKKGPI